MNDIGVARMLEQPGMTISGEFVGSLHVAGPDHGGPDTAGSPHGRLFRRRVALRTVDPEVTLQAQQRDQVLSRIIQKEPTPPRKLNKKIPQGLEPSA